MNVWFVRRIDGTVTRVSVFIGVDRAHVVLVADGPVEGSRLAALDIARVWPGEWTVSFEDAKA